MNQENVLEIRGLKSYFFTEKGVVPAVDEVDLIVPKGKIIGLVGESGCGKSMTAKSVMGLLRFPGKIAEGSILYDGKDLAQYKDKELRKYCGKEISMIFQEPMTSLNPVLKVGRQVRETLLIHDRSLNKSQAKEKTIEIFRSVGIPEPEKRPTTALDVTIEAQILRLMKQLRDETGTSILIITHNLGVIAEICDYVYVMYAGKIMEQAETFELFDHTMHPYTKGLVASIPRIGKNPERLYTIPGVVPNLLHLPKGCAFSNRCQYATDRCRSEKATLICAGEDHYIRCFHVEEELAGTGGAPLQTDLTQAEPEQAELTQAKPADTQSVSTEVQA